MKYSFIVIRTLVFSFTLWLISCGGSSIVQSTAQVSEAPETVQTASFQKEVENEEDPLAVDNLLDFQVTEESEEPEEDELKLTKAEKARLKKCKDAYEEAKMYMGTPDEELKVWKKFVKDYPGNYNPYLVAAKEKIESYENPKQSLILPTRSKQKEIKKGYLTEKQIVETVQNHMGEVQFCYRKYLEIDPHLRGNVWVEFSVSTEGKVMSPRVVSSGFPNAGVENCILDCMERWEFPKPLGGDTAAITYPFHFGTQS